MQDTPLEFTDEEKLRLDAWYEAGKPGAPHVWLGISADEYTAKRAAARASVERFLDSPTGSMMLNIIWAHRNAETFRLEDDGGPPLPDDFKCTPDVRGWHLRADYAARRLS
jgi:hypothetical protein